MLPPPLRRVFVDMNAYFASVEQQEDPRLRGRPIGVVPVMARTSCCIAASYEAKKFGIKTGTPVWEALRLCPRIKLVLARHEKYVEYHDKIVRAVGRCLPVDRILSIDEMVCNLIGDEREPANAERIARQMKEEIRQSVGEFVKCSIGIAPNTMLAKVGTDLQKPDGLVIIRGDELPHRLHSLKLTDFSGIGPRMEKRFHRFGIFSVEQLCGLSAKSMRTIWSSQVHGDRWYHLLRGDEVRDPPTKRQTVGHSHVLPPEIRTHPGVYGVMVKLIHKAAARLRALNHWCGQMAVTVRYEHGERWDAACKVLRTQDTLSLLRAFDALWPSRLPGKPTQAGMVLFDLTPTPITTPSLFDADRDLVAVSHAMDKINRQFGKNVIRFGTLCGSEDTAPTRIAFTQIPEFDPASI
jgi:DNA polymerase IV